MFVFRNLVLVVCAVSVAEAFAPLALSHSSARTATNAFGLRAARCTVAPVPRREAMGRVLSTLVGAGTVVGAVPCSSVAKPTKASAEDTIAAWNVLVDAMEKLDKSVVAPLVEAKDWDGILELLGQPEFTTMEDNLLKLVNGPVLNTDDKKTIGTRKRYGTAADVLYGIGGVKGAIANIDNPQVSFPRTTVSHQV